MSDQAEILQDTVIKTADDIISSMCHAAREVPETHRRGQVPNVSGSYGATKINGTASRMTEWRWKKEASKRSSSIASLDAEFRADPRAAKRSLINHYFRSVPRDSPPAAKDLLVERAKEEGGANLSEESEAISGPDEISALHVEAVKPWHSPTIQEAARAIQTLLEKVKEVLKLGKGKKCNTLDLYTLDRYNQMLTHLRMYTRDAALKGRWWKASISAAVSHGRSEAHGRMIRRWCRDYISNPYLLPTSPYGRLSSSVIFADEDLKDDIVEHLQSVGCYISARTLADFVNTPAMLEKLCRENPIHERTARRWLQLLNFRWKKAATGLYSDGHERQDVVLYRQSVFLPQISELLQRAAKFNEDGKEIERTEVLKPGEKETILHMHDESIFYAHDRRRLKWCHSTESPKPYAKGEGQTFMIAEFVSAKLGWLASPDGSQRARVTLKPGKEREGYFSNDEVLGQLSKAMDILDSHYPQYEHVFVLDNAKTHTKRAADAISARRMTKNPARVFGGLSVMTDANGRPRFDEQGKLLKELKPMGGARFADGTIQNIYYPSDHPKYPDFFKGMTQILLERGYDNAGALKAQCNGFRCVPGAHSCCQRRILFEEPDFKGVNPIAVDFCKDRGFKLIFLPKFHPELNFIEMCWGFAKRLYRELPESSNIGDLERNTIWALSQVPIASMRR